MYEVFAHFKVQDGCFETPESYPWSDSFPSIFFLTCVILNRNHIGDLMQEMFACDFENIVKLQNVNWWIKASSDPQVRDSCHTGNLPDKLVVLKDIKSFWGYNIEYLKNTLGEGLRFVWLVRDVRGWVSSWLYAPDRQRNFYTTWKFYITDFYAKYYTSCSSVDLSPEIKAIMEKYKRYLTDRSQPAHMRMAALWTIETMVHHYMLNKHLPYNHFLLKYEDISREPLEYTKHMFDFIGFASLPDDTARFVAQNTAKGHINDRHGSSRNSTEMVDIWKTRLDPCTIKQIEIIAQPATQLFGYVPYTDKPIPTTCKLDVA